MYRTGGFLRSLWGLGLGRVDRLVLAGSIIAILGSAYLIVQDRLLREWSGYRVDNREPIGQIIVAEQDVRRRIGNSMSWFPAFEQEVLFENDSIFTGENSGVNVRFKEGLSIDVASNSLVILRRARKDLVLDLQIGGVVATVQKGSTIQLRQGNSVAILEGSQNENSVKLQRSKKGKISVSTSLGGIEMRLNDQGKTIASNHAIEVDNDRVLKLVEDSLILRNPGFGAKVWIEEGGYVKFIWEEVIAGSSIRRIQISSEEDFSKNLIQEEVPASSYATKDLSVEGTYYWRIQGKKSGESDWDEISRQGEFVLLKKEPPLLIYPFHGMDIPSGGKSLDVKFEWQDKRGVDSYRWQVSSDSQFSSGFQEQVISGTHFVAGVVLEPGEYYWRVKAEGASPIADKWSDIYQFGIDRQARLEAKALADSSLKEGEIPDEDLKLDPAKEALNSDENAKEVLKELKAPVLSEKERKITLSFPETTDRSPAGLAKLLPVNPPALDWKNVEGAKTYEVEISATAKFAKIISSFETRTPRTVWKAAKPGVFYWRARARADETRSAFSDLGKIEIKLDPPRQKQSQNIIQKVSSSSEVETKRAKYKWKWEGVPRAHAYRVLVSSKSDFSKDVESIDTDNTEIEKDFKPGTSFLKVAAISDRNEIVSDFSTTEKIEVQNRFILPVPQVEGPENGLTLIAFGTAASPVVFEWHEVSQAKTYRIQFSNDSNFSKILQEKSVKDLDLALSSGDFSGQVFWRLRAEEGKYSSPWSASRYFTIKKQ